MRMKSTLFVKPGHTFDASPDGLYGDTDKTFRRKAIAEEIKASAYATDEGLVGVLLHVELRQHLIYLSHRLPRFRRGGASTARAAQEPVPPPRPSKSPAAAFQDGIDSKLTVASLTAQSRDESHRDVILGALPPADLEHRLWIDSELTESRPSVKIYGGSASVQSRHESRRHVIRGRSPAAESGDFFHMDPELTCSKLDVTRRGS